jgi:hypothetical protein
MLPYMNHFFAVRISAVVLSLGVSGLAWSQAPVPSSPTAPVTGTGPGPYTVQAPRSNNSELRGVRAVVSLRTSVTSKNAPEGKEIKATLERAVTLPDGTVLPRNTEIRGVVAHSSPHEKKKPNGALMLAFYEAVPKHDSTPILLLTKMQELSSTNNATVPMPGAKLGGTSNAGGGAQLNFEQNDRSDLSSNIKSSGLSGILLDASAPGSGVLYALGDDVYLDSGTQITLLIEKAPPVVQPVTPKP